MDQRHLLQHEEHDGVTYHPFTPSAPAGPIIAEMMDTANSRSGSGGGDGGVGGRQKDSELHPAVMSSTGQHALRAKLFPSTQRVTILAVVGFTFVLVMFLVILFAGIFIMDGSAWYLYTLILIPVSIFLLVAVPFSFITGHVVYFTDRDVVVKVCNMWLGELWTYKTHTYPYDEIAYLQVRARKGDSVTTGTTFNLVMRNTGEVVQLTADQPSLHERDKALFFLDQVTSDGVGTQFSHGDPRELVLEVDPMTFKFPNQLHPELSMPFNAPDFPFTFSRMIEIVNLELKRRRATMELVTKINVTLFLISVIMFQVGLIITVPLLIYEIVLSRIYESTIEDAINNVLYEFNTNELHRMGLQAEFKLQPVKTYGMAGAWNIKYHTLFIRSTGVVSSPMV